MRDLRDLVERLRKNDAKGQVHTAQEPPFTIQGEAADEIERLRGLVRSSEAPHEGWKLVPTKITAALASALEEGDIPEDNEQLLAYWQRKWDAILAAAPSPSAAEERK